MKLLNTLLILGGAGVGAFFLYKKFSGKKGLSLSPTTPITPPSPLPDSSLSPPTITDPLATTSQPITTQPSATSITAPLSTLYTPPPSPPPTNVASEIKCRYYDYAKAKVVVCKNDGTYSRLSSSDVRSKNLCPNGIKDFLGYGINPCT